MCEPQPFDDLFTLRLWRLRPALLRRARRSLPSLAWAEDAVAETLLAAVEQCQRHEPPTSLEGWLVGVLRHKIVDQLRQQGRQGVPPASHDDAADAVELAAPPHESPEAVAALRQWLARIEQQLHQLPPLQGQAMRLHLAWDAGAEEIAAALGVTTNHSGVLLHRARARLRQQLPDWAPRAARASACGTDDPGAAAG